MFDEKNDFVNRFPVPYAKRTVTIIKKMMFTSSVNSTIRTVIDKKRVVTAATAAAPATAYFEIFMSPN